MLLQQSRRANGWWNEEGGRRAGVLASAQFSGGAGAYRPNSGSGILPRVATCSKNSSIQGVLRKSITPEFMPASHHPVLSAQSTDRAGNERPSCCHQDCLHPQQLQHLVLAWRYSRHTMSSMRNKSSSIPERPSPANRAVSFPQMMRSLPANLFRGSWNVGLMIIVSESIHMNHSVSGCSCSTIHQRHTLQSECLPFR